MTGSGAIHGREHILMKKKTVIVLLAFTVVTAALAGCGSKKQAKTEEKKQTEVTESKEETSKENTKEQQQEEEEKQEKKGDTKADESAEPDANGVKVKSDDSVYSTSFSEEARSPEKPYSNKIKLCGKGEVGFNGNLRGWKISDQSTEKKVILTNGLGATAELYDSKIDAGDKDKINEFLKDYDKEHFTMEFFKALEGSEDAGDGFEGITYGGAKTTSDKKEIAFLVPVTDDHYLKVSVVDTSSQKLTTMDVFETLVLGMQDIAIAGNAQ